MRGKLLVILWISAGLANAEMDPPQNQTEVNFSDALVRGKYSLSNEGVVTVEADKALDSLLVEKKDFNDRLERSAEH